MYENFKQRFLADASSRPAGNNFTVESYEPHLQEFFRLFGGASFDSGLYRVMNIEAALAWSDAVAEAFPVEGEIRTCFGFDWLGRVFALERTRLVGGLPGVVMLEPGTGLALEIPCNIHTFHEEELIEFREEALAASFFNEWISFGGEPPDYVECVGYKKPLFLGGVDTVDNLERSDMDVYWAISAQLIRRARGLPNGTSISSARIG